ncbi:MAG: hypothetical protein ACO24H_09125 [Polynucleobacter sp.]
MLRNLFIFLITALTTGLNADTSFLKTEVAVRVAVTLTMDVIAAAETISAFGTGISIFVPGTLMVVASVSCGRVCDSGNKEGDGSGVWYCGACTAGVGTAMGGITDAGCFFSFSEACSSCGATRTPLVPVPSAKG